VRRQADALTVHDGTFIAKQSITKGIDNAIDGLLELLRGENFGKVVLTIAELDKKVSLIRVLA
jgi:NADPH-dependent curcumin reductase CurA